MTEEVWL